MGSKEKVFAKWQEYLKQSEKQAQTEAELDERAASIAKQEAEIKKRLEDLEEKERDFAAKAEKLSTPQDEIHSIFFLSEKEAKIKQKEQILEQRQKELEQRADDINRILKSFNNQHSVSTVSANELPLQSDCKSRNQMPLTTLLASHVSSHDNMAAQNSGKVLSEEDPKGAKYESPKFFVGSGSPSARKS